MHIVLQKRTATVNSSRSGCERKHLCDLKIVPPSVHMSNRGNYFDECMTRSQCESLMRVLRRQAMFKSRRLFLSARHSPVGIQLHVIAVVLCAPQEKTASCQRRSENSSSCSSFVHMGELFLSQSVCIITALCVHAPQSSGYT